MLTLRSLLSARGNRLLVITEPMAKIAIVLDMLYPSAWLAEKSAVDPEGRTNMELQIQVHIKFC